MGNNSRRRVGWLPLGYARGADTRSLVLAISILAAVYVFAWVVSPFVTSAQRSDLDIFFWPAAEAIVHGNALGIYSLPGAGIYPDANGPIGLVPLTVVVPIANALGVANDIRLRAAVADGTVAVLALLFTQQALHFIARGRGCVEWRLAAPLAFLAAPVLWIAVADFGHVEQPLELWLVLLAVGLLFKNQFSVAGVVLGLAILARTTALLYVVPLLVAAFTVGRARAAVRIAIGAAATSAIGIGPFLIANASAVAHSLITYRGALRIAGGTLWLAFGESPIAGVVQHSDTLIVVGFVVVICGLVAWRVPSAASTPAGLAGLLGLAAGMFPMLAKTSFPYYLLEPYVFFTVWWLARPGSAWNWRLFVPLGITADALLGKSVENLPGLSTQVVAEGVASSATLAILSIVVLRDLLRTGGSPERPITPTMPHAALVRRPD